MKETHFFYVPKTTETDELPREEAIHAAKVLRLKPGDDIYLMDGVGNFYHAQMNLVTAKHCLYEIKEILPQQPTWKGHIHLAIAPTKDMGRMEWLVEKATEIGFDEISFLNCQFSERHILKTERVERIVISAMKQSRKAWKPKINSMINLTDFIKTNTSRNKFICHCYPEIKRRDLFEQLSPLTDDVLVMIGPEGDFSVAEVEAAMAMGFNSASLGNSRLRTETAGISAIMQANLKLRK